MQTGKLDEVIELFSPTEINDRGMLTLEYTSEGEVWAHIISQRGSEAFEAARVNAKQTLRCMVRYIDNLDIKWQMKWAGQTYNIIAIDRTGRRSGELWFTAQVVGAL